MKQIKIEFSALSEIEREIFKHVYYIVKEKQIFTDLMKILSSREKDDELYRSRYASNEALFYEFWLKNKTGKWAKGEQENSLKELKRIDSERKTFESYDLNLSDLIAGKIDFDKCYENFSDEYRQMFIGLFEKKKAEFSADGFASQPNSGE